MSYEPVKNYPPNQQYPQDQNMGGQPMGQPIGGQPMGQQYMGQQQMGQPMGGQPMGGQPMGGQPMGGQPMGGQPMSGQPMGGQPMGGPMGQQMPPQQYQQPMGQQGFSDPNGMPSAPPQGEAFNESDYLPQVPGFVEPIPDLDCNQQWWQRWEQNQNLKINDNYRLFKLPKLEGAQRDSMIIGVIDQSGSMGDCFHHLAKEWNRQIKSEYPNSKCVIFHNFAKVQEQLEEYPDMGTTHVEAGFRELNTILGQGNIPQEVTIIFVSDGMDNNPSTIYQRLDSLYQQIPRGRKVNFLTIGVGDGFPTYMAMQLRQMYHNGENHIPPVFLVYHQHQYENWKVTFEIVKSYLVHNRPVQLSHQLQLFPWVAPSQYLYENSYVWTTDPIDHITMNGYQQVQCVKEMSPQEMLQVSSMLLSNAQTSNLRYGNNQTTKAEILVSQRITKNLEKKFWGRKNKKKEEKEQLVAVKREMAGLEQDPNLKQKKNEQDADSGLALKLAVGGVAAGVGLYWLATNYGDFANIIGGMDFGGVPDCGCCGEICEPVCNFFGDSCECCGDLADKVTDMISCDACGDCCGKIVEGGSSCCGEVCKFAGDILGYVCNFLCGLLGG